MRVPLSHQAESEIRRYIVENRLGTGDPLPSEGEFAALLDMGKTSIREGVRRLEMLGNVDVRHGLGLFVGRFTLDSVVSALPYDLAVNDTPLREILQVRCALEEGLVVQASRAMSASDLQHLEVLVDQMRKHSSAGEVPANIDHEFHQALYAPLGNELISRLIETFWQIYANFSAEQQSPVNHHAVEDHEEIVRAIRSGDADRMVRAIAVHFAPIQTSLELDSDSALKENLS